MGKQSSRLSISVTGFLLLNGKVLLVQRSHKDRFLPDHFELPGGKIENEEPKDALAREFREEVGISIHVERPFHVYTYPVRQYNVIGIAFFVVPVENAQNVVLSSEHRSFQWATERDVQTLQPMTELMREVILEGFNQIHERKD